MGQSSVLDRLIERGISLTANGCPILPPSLRFLPCRCHYAWPDRFGLLHPQKSSTEQEGETPQHDTHSHSHTHTHIHPYMPQLTPVFSPLFPSYFDADCPHMCMGMSVCLPVCLSVSLRMNGGNFKEEHKCTDH